MAAIRTDLALEAALEHATSLPAGVQMKETTQAGVTITHVQVTDAAGAKQLGKPVGQYYTFEGQAFYHPDPQIEETAQVLAEHLGQLLPEGPILVVGLGNPHITPDALGPMAVDHILATRHISAHGTPENELLAKLRPVASLAPGVLAQTGVETGEIVASLVKEIKPVAVVAIDALASRSLARLGRTIQLADSGIAPGSGVQNRRMSLDQETLGVPVFALGVPTVVDGSTLAADLLRYPPQEEPDTDLRQLFEPDGQAMMVTPREIDLLVERAAETVSLALNIALQPTLSIEEINALCQ